jgi:predicted dehydrogenase
VAEETLRIGFVGAGAIVRRRHVPGLLKLDNVEFAAVCNRRPESTAAVAEELGIRQTFADWRELVNWDGVDIVWIGTWPYLHREATIAALEAGKHVFCQARMAMDYADAKAMYDASLKSDRTAALCVAPHYLNGQRVVQRLLDEGVIGTPYHALVTSFSSRYATTDEPLHWRQMPSISGVNILDLGMMIEAQQRWLGYPRRVTATQATLIKERPSGDGGVAPVELPDTITAAVELENGALCTFVVSGVANHSETANAFQIFGSNGTIRYQSDEDRVYAGRVGEAGLKEVPIPPEEARPWTVEADFIAAVRAGKRSSYPSFWDGLKYMELTDAIVRSAETGRAVDLPYEQLTPPPA